MCESARVAVWLYIVSETRRVLQRSGTAEVFRGS